MIPSFLSGRDVIRLQPEPVVTRRCLHRLPDGQAVTAIYRVWSPGQAAFCRLCPECHAFDDSCLMVFGLAVPREAAPLASSVNPAKGGAR